MKKKLLLTLMLVFAITAALNAQDQQQTAAPFIIVGDGDNLITDYAYPYDGSYFNFFVHHSNAIYSIENCDESEAIIYYRENHSDWCEYNGDLLYGNRIMVEAYAVAEGKLPSEIVSADLYDITFYLYSSCLFNGIHYYIFDYYLDNYDVLDGYEIPPIEAAVSCRSESKISTDSYSGDIVIPSEIAIDENTPYAVTEIRPLAFASTYSWRCDITSVELPGTIREVETSAFAGCAQLQSIIIHAVAPPDVYTDYDAEEMIAYNWNTSGNDNWDILYYANGFDWSQLDEQVTLFVPNESLAAYQAHEEWGKFSNIVPFIGAGPGDVDGDGSINIIDVTSIIDMILSDDTPAYCDVDGDGVVNIVDITYLIDKILNGN